MRSLARPAASRRTALNYADALVLLGVAAAIYGILRLALGAPAEIAGPQISLSPAALPRYTLFSLGRMAAAYLLSLLFALVYGYVAAHSRAAERILMPVLDVLQSIPILSFLPVVLLGLTAILPEAWAVEMASIALILTSQAWNLAFSVYQSLTTLPRELEEATDVFRLGRWLRFRYVELPFATIPLLWNSMMSWAGGWFFLMASETFAVGPRNFRLPGLGSYLYEAADQGNVRAVLWGLAALVGAIILLDQVLWRPLAAWSERFKNETLRGEQAPGSWLHSLLERSTLVARLQRRLLQPLSEGLDRLAAGRAGSGRAWAPSRRVRVAARILVAALALALILYSGGHALGLLLALPARDWLRIALGLGATALRVAVAMVIALAWTLPLGVAIGTNRRLSAVLQPVVQLVASVPATALFPVVLLAFLRLPGGLNVAAILLMLLGTQWYILFNAIAGASAIPADLHYTTNMLGLGLLERWRTLFLPALAPYLVTGMITASGGAWNASIVAEYVTFGGRQYQIAGVGALISEATYTGNFALLLGATLSLIVAVVLINRLFWRRLYAYVAEKCRVE